MAALCGTERAQRIFLSQIQRIPERIFQINNVSTQEAGLPRQTPQQAATNSSQADTGPEQTFLRESTLHKRLQTLAGISQEHLGPGKEEHILVLAKVQGLGQSIPPCMGHGGALGMTLQS